jgi:hypothetical protein
VESYLDTEAAVSENDGEESSGDEGTKSEDRANSQDAAMINDETQSEVDYSLVVNQLVSDEGGGVKGLPETIPVIERREKGKDVRNADEGFVTQSLPPIDRDITGT